MLFACTVMGIFVLLIHLYYFCAPMLHAAGLAHPIADRIMLSMRDVFSSMAKTKLFALILFALSVAVRNGKSTEVSWKQIALLAAAGMAVYAVPIIKDVYIVYIITTVTGAALTTKAVSLAARKVRGIEDDFDSLNDPEETFKQCEQLVETPTSVNIPTVYKWRGKFHKGWINVVNPFRATLILGTPGSGKSFSVYNPFIEQTMAKGFTGICYDYKYPDLTEIMFNELRLNVIKDPSTGQLMYKNPKYRSMKVPEFYVLNFTDARKSNRCNPLKSIYFPDVADATDVSEVLFKNVSRESGNGGDKFFVDSAKEYIGCCIYFLAHYKNEEYGIEEGALCDIPHFVELISKDYKKVFQMLMKVPQIESKMQPFVDAFEADSQDQLQGQIASARIPMNKLASPDLYWVLSGDDFTLDVNNPDEPKIVCIGNDPLRDEVYGPSLALFTSRIFKEVYKPKKKGRPCIILLDEMPTIYLKDVDKIIATARSYKVAMVMGAQDKSQMIRDYRKEYADVLFNTVGTIISGQVNGQTAQDLSRTMGKEKRRQRSQTQTKDGDSFSYSYHDVELLPASRIETLSQGIFFGKVADDFGAKIAEKKFCGEIQRNIDEWNRKTKDDYTELPFITSFGEDDLWKDVHDDPMRSNLLETYAGAIVEEDSAYQEMSDEEKQSNYADMVYDVMQSFTDKEKEDILKDAWEKLCEEKRKNDIEDNYFRIKDDINKLIEIEIPDENNDNGHKNDPMDE